MRNGEKSRSKADEMRESLTFRRPSWTMQLGIKPDLAALSLITLGLLSLAGLNSASAGPLIRAIGDFFRRWLGDGAYLIAALPIFFGSLILLRRHSSLPTFTQRRSHALNGFLYGLLILIYLCLASLYHGDLSGGKIGVFLVTPLVKWMGAGAVRKFLWLIFIPLCLITTRAHVWLSRFFLESAISFSEWKADFTHQLSQDKERIAKLKIKRQSKPVSPTEKIIKEPIAPEPETMENFMKNNHPLYHVSVKSDQPTEDERREIARPPSNERTEVNMETKTQEKKDLVISGNTLEGVSDPKDEEKTKTAVIMPRNYLPPLNLLEPEMGFWGNNTDLEENARRIEVAMDEFGVPVRVVGCSVGPTVIQYQVVPGSVERSKGTSAKAKNIKVAQVGQLERDLSVSLGCANLSIQAPAPGKSFIGIDLPNPNAMTVRLRPLIESREFQKCFPALNIALGRDITGKPVVVNLEQMPHLLVAGTTNSGKSICLRSMAICLAMNHTPEELRFVIIDPKRVEFNRFNGLPHLLGKVETEYERNIAALQWAVQEMRNRYKLFEVAASRNLDIYNRYAEANGMKKLPKIVILIDEMAEIMRGPDKEGRDCVDRLASLARATGIHLVCATQRPDVTIITGKIKTNIPARIALNVASAIDSRVIMGKHGAEKLLGRGDMYFVNPAMNVPVRVQGPLLTDEEIVQVVELWKKLSPKPAEESAKQSPWDDLVAGESSGESSRDDKILREAVKLVCRTKKASASYLSGKLKISFPTASRILNRMEEMGVVGPMQLGGRAREVLWDESDAENFGEDAGHSEDDGWD